MIRLVLDESGGLVVDLAGRAFGRGAWAHPRSDCLLRVARGGAQRGLKANVRIEGAALLSAVRSAADRRVEALLASARGAGKIAAGSDAAHEAFERAEAELVIVARDARAAASEGWVTAAAGSGKAVFWGDKHVMGRAVARSDTAVLAVTDHGLSRAIAHAIALSSLHEPANSVAEAQNAAGHVLSEVS
jgi:ribosomal protein L7Ae-like RNA K-turn-binding protein